MRISYQESRLHTCPACQHPFYADLWLILDAQEHPEQVAALRQHHLNQVVCPQCMYTSSAETPLLFHDSAARQVIVAIPAGFADHEWPDLIRDLHAMLLGSIPIEERRAYLADVQVAQDLAGIAHRLDKAERRAAGSAPEPLPGKQIELPSAPTDTHVQSTATEPEPQADDSALLIDAVQQLVQATVPDEIQATVQQHPVLLTPAATTALEELADVAVEQREYALAEQLHSLRVLLTRMQSTDVTSIDLDTIQATVSSEAVLSEPEPQAEQQDVPIAAYQALLRAQSPDELTAVARAQPVLLEPWIDAALSRTIDEILEAGDESLAYVLEQRRELLAELRPQMTAATASPENHTDSTQEAIEALLTAGDDETRTRALIEYPVLLTDEAQAALWQLASEARSYGDEDLALYAVECRALLQKVREQLADS